MPGVPIHESGLQFERVHIGGIHAPPKDIDRLETGNGPHHHLALADRQVVAFQQHDAEVAGDVGVFEIGFIVRARRQDRGTSLRTSDQRLQTNRGNP